MLNRMPSRARSLNLPPRSTDTTDPRARAPAGIATVSWTRTSRVTRASTRSSMRARSLVTDVSACSPITESAGTTSSSNGLLRRLWRTRCFLRRHAPRASAPAAAGLHRRRQASAAALRRRSLRRIDRGAARPRAIERWQRLGRLGAGRRRPGRRRRSAGWAAGRPAELTRFVVGVEAEALPQERGGVAAPASADVVDDRFGFLNGRRRLRVGVDRLASTRPRRGSGRAHSDATRDIHRRPRLRYRRRRARRTRGDSKALRHFSLEFWLGPTQVAYRDRADQIEAKSFGSASLPDGPAGVDVPFL